MPEFSQDQNAPSPEKDGAVPSCQGEAAGAGSEIAGQHQITVPAKSVRGAAKAPPGIASPALDKPNERESERKSLEWRRKAKNRRLRANRSGSESDGKELPGSDTPNFTPLRMPDWSPGFDQIDGTPRAPGRSGLNRWKFLLTVGGLLVAALATRTAVLLWNDHFKSGKQTLQAGEEELEALDEQSAIRFTVDKVPEARRVVELFFAASTPEEKTALVRGGKALLPAMRAYYASHPDESAKVQLSNSVRFMADGGREFIIVGGIDADLTRVTAAVELHPDGPRLDWRHLTGAGEVEWGRWIAERPPGAVEHRVLASLDNYYEGIFADRESWICLKVTDVSRGPHAWAYVERYSTAGYHLVRNLARRNLVRLLGRFEFPEESVVSGPGSAIPQIFLHSVEENGWLDRSAEAATPE